MFKKKQFNKKYIVIAFAVVALLMAVLFTYKKFYKSEPKRTYEALVSVREMSGAGSAEEKARSTMYPGDVIAIKEGVGSWSMTERVSYLIVKLSITESQANKLVSPLAKKVDKNKVDEEVERMKESNLDISKEDLKRFKEEAENREDTIRQREYSLNLKEILPENFDTNSLVSGQPVEDKIFGWNVVDNR